MQEGRRHAGGGDAQEAETQETLERKRQEIKDAEEVVAALNMRAKELEEKIAQEEERLRRAKEQAELKKNKIARSTHCQLSLQNTERTSRFLPGRPTPTRPWHMIRSPILALSSLSRSLSPSQSAPQGAEVCLFGIGERQQRCPRFGSSCSPLSHRHLQPARAHQPHSARSRPQCPGAPPPPRFPYLQRRVTFNVLHVVNIYPLVALQRQR